MTEVDQLLGFVLVLVRVASVVAFLPIIREGAVPRAVKALLALSVALVLFPLVRVPADVAAWRPVQLGLYAAAEVLFGVLTGVSALMIFRSIRAAGEMVGQQMGMALAFVADPTSGIKSSVPGQFCEMVGLLVFFAVGAHLWMFRALHESFMLWPLGQFLSADFLRRVSVAAAVHSLVMAFQIAAPLLLLTFLVSLVMALMARLVPEVNVLILGFPLRVGVGLVGLALFVPLLARCCAEVSRMTVTFMTGVAGGA